MVNAKTQLKNAAQNGASLTDVMATVNDLMCEGNDECMFVTIFLGVLNITTGHFAYVNGGHDVPLLKKQGAGFDWLPTRPGQMPGFMKGTKYVQDEIVMQKGDVLFLYTDGVTEAENTKNEPFAEEGLKERLNKCAYKTAEEILQFTKNEIDLFADGAEQFDDITMLALAIRE